MKNAMKPAIAFGTVIQALADRLGFNLFAADGSGIKIESDGYMELNITAYGSRIVAVNHCKYIGEWGESCYDPEIQFWIDANGNWYPISYENQQLGIFNMYVTFKEGNPDRFYRSQQHDLAHFCVTWAANIKDQGFMTSDAVTWFGQQPPKQEVS